MVPARRRNNRCYVDWEKCSFFGFVKKKRKKWVGRNPKGAGVMSFKGRDKEKVQNPGFPHRGIGNLEDAGKEYS